MGLVVILVDMEVEPVVEFPGAVVVSNASLEVPWVGLSGTPVILLDATLVPVLELPGITVVPEATPVVPDEILASLVPTPSLKVVVSILLPVDWLPGIRLVTPEAV